MSVPLWIVVGFVAILGLTVVALGTLLSQVLRQQGRFLLRVETLETLVGRLLEASATREGTAGRSLPQGIPVGSAIEPFRLPDLSGRFVSLEDYRGKRLLLTNWSSACGWCGAIASDLAQLEDRLREHGTELVLVSQGDVEANRKLAEEHGLTAPILLRSASAQVDAFRNVGTPAAYLVDEEGRVVKPLALGATQVPVLAAEAADGRTRLLMERPLSESRILRHGLPAGTRAPAFELPEVRGGVVSLDDHLGRSVLLVFSAPDCGPCEALGRDLAALQEDARASDLDLILVGRGEPEANRRKAEEQGIGFPVVVQDRWKLAKEYGIFATPVAFLVGEDGLIARDVAVGHHAIIRLAREGMAGVGRGR